MCSLHGHNNMEYNGPFISWYKYLLCNIPVIILIDFSVLPKFDWYARLFWSGIILHCVCKLLFHFFTENTL